jgi:hypothetical protein
MKTKIILTVVVALISGLAVAETDESECRRKVNLILEVEATLSPNNVNVDNSKRQSQNILNWRSKGESECRIAARISPFTSPQAPEKQSPSSNIGAPNSRQ